MKLQRFELAEHSAAARIFERKLFLADKWDMEADFTSRVVWVAGTNAQGKKGRWWIPFEQIVYGEPADTGYVLGAAAARDFAAGLEKDMFTEPLETVSDHVCPTCHKCCASAAGLAAHMRGHK